MYTLKWYIMYKCPACDHIAGICAQFSALPPSAVASLQALPPPTQPLVYGLGVAYGLLQARQLLGSRGLSQHVPLGGSTLGQAVVALQTLVTAQV